jgi:hypothetical protein
MLLLTRSGLAVSWRVRLMIQRAISYCRHRLQLRFLAVVVEERLAAVRPDSSRSQILRLALASNTLCLATETHKGKSLRNGAYP